jgi:uncharacterized tellurite resistance protein B-like protein
VLNQLLARLASALDPTVSDSLDKQDIERVAAILLVEIARADHEVDPEEHQAIIKALGQSSSLSDSELTKLVSEAFADVDHAVSLHDHVGMINEHFSKDHKLALVEHMWRVAVADGNIDGYEEYTIRKLSDLLYIKHRDYMQAKLRVLEEDS